MNKVEALRLKPGTELRVQHGNNRPLAEEKRIRVGGVKTLSRDMDAALIDVPLRFTDAKRVAAAAKYVSVISTDGEDFGSNEVVHIAEES